VGQSSSRRGAPLVVVGTWSRERGDGQALVIRDAGGLTKFGLIIAEAIAATESVRRGGLPGAEVLFPDSSVSTVSTRSRRVVSDELFLVSLTDVDLTGVKGPMVLAETGVDGVPFLRAFLFTHADFMFVVTRTGRGQIGRSLTTQTSSEEIVTCSFPSDGVGRRSVMGLGGPFNPRVVLHQRSSWSHEFLSEITLVVRPTVGQLDLGLRAGRVLTQGLVPHGAHLRLISSRARELGLVQGEHIIPSPQGVLRE